ncbi:hypothetical protein GCM10009642_07780 [Nocardiopsis metallicus]
MWVWNTSAMPSMAGLRTTVSAWPSRSDRLPEPISEPYAAPPRVCSEGSGAIRGPARARARSGLPPLTETGAQR